MTAANAIRVAILGPAGRMGSRLIALALQDARFSTIVGVNPAEGPSAVAPAPARTVNDLAQALPIVDVVIDFTAPEATPFIAPRVAAAKKAYIVGTTGVGADGHARLKEAAATIPVVVSPNMSVGVNLLFELVRQAAAALAHYDIEIVEAHHNQKKDAPSGTAMKLADIAAEASQRSRSDFRYGREGQVGARSKKEIGVLAVRAGDIVGDHTVFLAGPGERLELTHRAHSRDAFAGGALDAAVWAVAQKPGLYTMKDVLGLKL